MRLKHCLSVLMLGIGGSIALYLGDNVIAAFCFTAIATWGLVNGAKEINKKTEAET